MADFIERSTDIKIHFCVDLLYRECLISASCGQSCLVRVSMNSMKNKSRRKPRGVLQIAKIVSGNSEASGIVTIELPNSKDEIELEVLNQFITSVSKRQDIPVVFLGAPVQNKENDLDFLVETVKGRRWIELMEVAPLETEAGGYESAKSLRNAYDDAKWVFKKLKDKSDKYGDTAKEAILLVYTTEEKFSLGVTATKILKHWAATGDQSFEQIYLFRPGVEDGAVEIIFPTEFDAGFNPEAHKDQKALILDTSSIQLEQNEHGSSAKIFISPLQLLELGVIRPSRTSRCPCGSGERYKNCHGKLK